MRDGRSQSGARRYVCRGCGRRSSSLTGTIFEGSKKDLPTWVGFVTLMCHNVQIDAAADMRGITRQTAFEWRHRVMATVDGWQGRVVLRDRVWIDEMHVTDTALSGSPEWRHRRGLPQSKICIAVAIDVRKNAVAVECGRGKPGAAAVKGALLGHIAPGSTVVHDMERSHNALVRAVGGADEAYRADAKDPGHLAGMELVNSLCSWIRRYLWKFPGMKPGNLQSYLNWFAYLFRVRRDEEEWPRTERVLRHLMMTDASFKCKRG